MLTPAASPSAACTVAAQEAQLIPSMGRTIRALLMELVRRRRGPPIGGGGLHDKEALQHVHAAAEAEFARLFWSELDGRGLKRRKRGVDAEVLEHHALRAIRRLVAVELEPHGLAGPHHDGIGGVPPFTSTRTSCTPATVGANVCDPLENRK